MKRARRNPDIVGDLVLIGVVGGVLYFGGKALAGAGLGNLARGAAGAVNTATLPITGNVGGGTSGQGASQPSSAGISNPTGASICQLIQTWRNYAPGIQVFGVTIPFTGDDPGDWNGFRAFMISYTQGTQDPGPTPPSCWYPIPNSAYTTPGGQGY